MTAALASAATAVTGAIHAPSIEYSQLSPMLVVFGAAVAGVLVEAFAPRFMRRRESSMRSAPASWCESAAVSTRR